MTDTKYKQSNGVRVPSKTLDNNVVAAENGCILWQSPRNKGGYGLVTFEKKQMFAHRLAWQRAYGPIPEGLHVCHHCDTPACVNPNHLFIGSDADNQRDKTLKGRQPKGATHYATKLTDAQLIAIRNDLRPQHQIAAEYGITQGHVSDIKNRKKRGSIPGGVKPEEMQKNHRRLTIEQVTAIRQDIRNQYVIAQEYGIVQAQVSRIKNGKQWKFSLRTKHHD